MSIDEVELDKDIILYECSSKTICLRQGNPVQGGCHNAPHRNCIHKIMHSERESCPPACSPVSKYRDISLFKSEKGEIRLINVFLHPTEGECSFYQTCPSIDTLQSNLASIERFESEEKARERIKELL